MMHTFITYMHVCWKPPGAKAGFPNCDEEPSLFYGICYTKTMLCYAMLRYAIL